MKKLIRNSDGRCQGLQDCCWELEKKLASHNEVVQMVLILSPHCVQIQKLPEERNKLVIKPVALYLFWYL